LPPQLTHVIPGVDVVRVEPFRRPTPLVPEPSPAPRAAREGHPSGGCVAAFRRVRSSMAVTFVGQIAWPRRTGLRDPDRWWTGGPWLNWVLRCCSDHICMLTVVSFESDVFLSTRYGRDLSNRYGHILPAVENLVSAMLKKTPALKSQNPCGIGAGG
jgi:hypothetical protein